jgi:hypothetical protein
MKKFIDPHILTIKSSDDMLNILKRKGRTLSSFKRGDVIHVWNKMSKGYSYQLEANPGKDFEEGFTPFSTPGEILALGAFGGKYLNDCLLEFPAEWFLNALALDTLRPNKEDIEVNYFKIDSRLPRGTWIQNGWIPGSSVKGILSDPSKNPDERGWFQWYCRYWMGRRIPELDFIQIKRWKAFVRHSGAVKKACNTKDLSCRPRQRQALLHWAWDFTI